MGAKGFAVGFGVLLAIGLVIALTLYFTKVTCPKFGFQCQAATPAPTLAPTTAAPVAAATVLPSSGTIQAVALVPTPAPVGIAPAAATSTTAMAPAAAVASTAAVYPRLLGCYTDNDSRMLPDMLSSDTSNNTPGTCAGMASLKGYKYFALQDGGYCFGGNNDAYNALGVSGGCTMACPADKSQDCGGAWSNSVWQAHA